MASCGPPPSAEEPVGSKASSLKSRIGTVAADGVTFAGVHYRVDAEPFVGPDGWSVAVSVEASIEDDQDHSFVHDQIEPHHSPTALRFASTVEGADGSIRSLTEPASSAGKKLETHSPGDEIHFERDFSSGVKPGGLLELTVSIWGTEVEDGPRLSPDLARVLMYVSKGGKADLEVELLDPTAEVPENHLTRHVGAHEITIKPYSPYTDSPKTVASTQVVVMTCGETTVRIKGDELVVDGAHYGKLDKGAAILVDHGKVSVDGEPRTGEKLLNAKLLDYHPNPVSEHRIGGYTVLVSPGVDSASQIVIGGTTRFVLDDLELEIYAGKLYINDVSHGEIDEKATIKVYFGDVYIGDEKLEPEKEGDEKDEPEKKKSD